MTENINITDEEFLPLYGNIVVEVIKEEAKTTSGLILSKEDKPYAQLGKVIMCGIGDLREDGSIQPLVVKVGDTIAYSLNAQYRPIRSQGIDYVILCEREIYGVYSQDDNK